MIKCKYVLTGVLIFNDFARLITNSRVVYVHVRSVGLRSMTGKDVVVDLPGYVPLDFFYVNEPITSFVLPEEDSTVLKVFNSSILYDSCFGF